VLRLRKRGAVWHVSGTVAGRHIRRSTGCRRRADAETWARRLERELLARHAEGPAARLTLAEAALHYMQSGGERRFLGVILDHFGPDFLLRDLDGAAVNTAAAALYPDAAPATVNRQLVTPLAAILNLAAEEGWIAPRRLRKRREGPGRTRWLSPAEAEDLLAACSGHLAPIVIALLGSGARVSELLATQAQDWHPETGELWLAQTKSGVPRMARLPARARDALQAAGLPASGALFRTPSGAPYVLRPRQVPIRAAFARARAAAGLGAEVTPHVLRHTWATWFYAQTRDFGGLLDLGGWAGADMALRYRKAAPQALAPELAAAGWHFDRLGRDLPPAPPARRLRALP
jgi:integrase